MNKNRFPPIWPVMVLLCTALIAVATLYLLERQHLIQNVKAINRHLLQLENANVQRLYMQLQSTLQSMARHEAAQRLASGAPDQAMQSFREKRSLEAFFLDVQRAHQGLLYSLRFIDREGVEQVVVRKGIVVNIYESVINDDFFQRGIAQRPYQTISTIGNSVEEGALIEISIPLSASGIASGLISISVDLKVLLKGFESMKQAANLSGIYLVSDQGKLLQYSLFGEGTVDRAMIKDIFERVENTSTQAPVLDYEGDVWTYFRNAELNTYFLFQTSQSLLADKLYDETVPLMLLLFGAMIIAFLLRKSSSGLSAPRLSKEEDSSIRVRELANITHEFRTPLNSILGMLSLLRETKLSSKQIEFIDLATRSADWLLEVANELLDYSKLASGKLKLEKIDFNLRNTIRDVTEMLSIQAYQKGLEIGCLVNSQVPERVVGDPTRIRQVLINLIGNAVKFTDRGDIAISATVEQIDSDIANVKFEISDTGIGIDADMQKEIFSEFRQADSSSARRHGGTGLGLTICKKLVEMMGGEIGVGENSNGGATFWFTVPLQVAHVDTPQVSVNDLSGYRVFVVGEVEGNRKTISTVINKWGMFCDIGGDFEQVIPALKKAQSEKNAYAVCLIDVSMSSSGDKAFEAVRAINENLELSQTSIIILTAKGAPGEGQTARELGVSAYLTKPINRSDLKQTLAQVIGASRHIGKPVMVTKHSLKEEQARESSKVLLVEDHPTNQKVLSGFLLRFGVEVDVAGNGTEAVDAVRKKHYDLVLMDIQLPEVDGLQAIKKIRKYEQNLGRGSNTESERAMRTPIIAMSAGMPESERKRIIENGADDFLLKPINMKVVEDILSKWGLIELDVDIPSRFSEKH